MKTFYVQTYTNRMNKSMTSLVQTGMEPYKQSSPVPLNSYSQPNHDQTISYSSLTAHQYLQYRNYQNKLLAKNRVNDCIINYLLWEQTKTKTKNYMTLQKTYSCIEPHSQIKTAVAFISQSKHSRTPLLDCGAPVTVWLTFYMFSPCSHGFPQGAFVMCYMLRVCVFARCPGMHLYLDQDKPVTENEWTYKSGDFSGCGFLFLLIFPHKINYKQTGGNILIECFS